MRQVFQNIISNALKFSKHNAQPEIKIWSDFTKEKSIQSQPAEKGDYCRIYIADNGIGFNPEFADKIFTIFQRLHGRDKYPGTGIGLAICRKIVLNHHGLIFASSKENEGALFHVIIPVSEKK